MKDTIHIVSYSDTPVAGVPVILARCIAARTAHNSVCVWRRNSYGNGVSFKGGVEWSRDERNASELLEQADLLIVHNGKVAPQHRRIISAKPVITLAHNYRWNVDSSYVDAGNPGAVVGQYQAALPEFAGWHVVPNPIPLWEPDYQPAPKPDRIAICYTPSAKHEQFPEDHKLYWHSKGYRTTMEVLEQLAKRHSIQLETIRRDQVDLVESLAMKRRSHIVIDECVTGSYHRNSLEGLAAGCVVINGMHLRPKVQEVFRHCAGEPKEAALPFEFADLRSLEDRLTDLIQRGSQTLTEMGRSNRQWMEAHWDFATQWSRFWLPLIELANKHSSKTKPRSQSGAAQQFAPGASRDPLVPAKSVSVIIPHGGDDRLPLLSHTVRMLREVPEVGEIIIVEFGPRPTVVESAASNSGTGIFHIFIRDEDQFHKARAMNAGLSIASKDLILWLDNDLIVPPGFLRRAAAELEKRELHCLIPWRTVQFLSENETQSILEGRTAYSAATPVASYSTASGCRGGAILVRREFALSCGGMRVEFHGWGGEDDAWFHFASRMGRAAVTELADQTLYHLYHRLSGGYGGDEHVKTNPRYGRNVALLRKLQTLQAKAQILENFPVTPNFQSPWPASVILRFVLASVDSKLCPIFAALGRKFRETFGVEFEEIALHKLFQSTGPLIGPCVLVVFGADELEANWHEKIPGLGAARVILVDLPPGKRAEGPPMPIDALVTSDAATIKRLAGTSIATYFFPQPNEQSETIMGLFQILVQAVSMEAPIALEAQEEKANQRLNIGLAISPRRGFTNVDCGPASAAPSDVIIDLRRKWPWPDNSVRQIEAQDFLEHLPDKNFTMNEMWRVMKHDAEATISLYTTDGPGAWQDPLHVSFWNRGSFLYYQEGSSYRERFAQRFGIEARFSITQAKVEQTEHGPLLTVVLKAIKQ